MQQVFEPQQARGILHLGLDLWPWHLQVLQTEGHVVVNAHVRVERIALEHHGTAALGSTDVIDHLPVDADVARAGRLQTCNHPQQGGLAAARGSDKHHKFAMADGQIDAVQHRGAVKGLDNVGKFKRGQWGYLWDSSGYLTPALAMPVVMYFCKKAKTSVIGTRVITVIASR